MNRVRAIVKDERGVAVVVALVALVTLTALVLAFLAVSGLEPQISANLASATQARHVAEAGVEAAFDQLALLLVNPANAATAWDAALVGATCAQGAIVPNTQAGQTLPGLTAASGTFTVRVRNDCLAADSTLTGVAIEGSATADANSRVIVTSIGTVGTATKTVTAVVKRIALPTINGALSFPGLESDVDFSGSSFTIQGVDTNMDGTSGPASPVFGISVGVAANEAGIDTALMNNQQNSVTGKSQLNPATTATGDNTVAFDNSLTSAAVTDFVNAIKASADITVNSTASNPFSIRNMGDSCSSNVNASDCWGTTSHPKIVYVKGDGTGTYNALDISGGSTGTGILIVENGNLDITGNFQWNGPVIVTGTNVKVRYHGGGNQSIHGTVIVNELSHDGSTNLEADISGNASIYYSTQAINLVMNGIGGRRLVSLYSWQEQ